MNLGFFSPLRLVRSFAVVCTVIVTIAPTPAWSEWTNPLSWFSREDKSVAEGTSIQVRKQGLPYLMVFVHGVLGDARTTWTNSTTGKSWPELIAKDPALKDFDILVHGFESSLKGKNQTPSDLADRLKIRLQKEEAFDKYRGVVFVAHSMGGLVVREFLNRYSAQMNLSAKVPMLYFVSVPGNGSAAANAAGAISKSQQLVALTKLPDNLWLQANQQNWIANPLSKSTKTYCAAETEPTYGLMIVPRESAIPFCTESLTAVRRNHIDIAKPATTDDDIYVSLLVALQETLLKKQKIVLDSNSLPILIAQLRSGFPLNSYSVRGELNASQVLADQDSWIVADLAFEEGATLDIGEKSLTIDVKGRLVPFARGQEVVRSYPVSLRAPTLSASPQPSKPSPRGAGGAGSGEGASGGPGPQGEGGTAGSNGKDAGSLTLMVRQIPAQPVRIALVAQSGGRGGDGGDGGPGGAGMKGSAGRSNLFDCGAGGGRGGNGGPGGKGGAAGFGGAAGAGGTLTVIHPMALSAELAASISVDRTAADRGAPGKPGNGGSGGPHGDGGNGSGNCGGGSPGADGAAGATGDVQSDTRPEKGTPPKMVNKPLTTAA